MGTGRLEASIAERIQREQLSDSVRLLAPVPRLELRRLLDESWCLVLASRSEGLPRIILEAMAAGRPVVATRVGGIGELVTDASGRLVPPDDAPALASALSELLGDARQSTTMGLEARRRARRIGPPRPVCGGDQSSRAVDRGAMSVIFVMSGPPDGYDRPAVAARTNALAAQVPELVVVQHGYEWTSEEIGSRVIDVVDESIDGSGAETPELPRVLTDLALQVPDAVVLFDGGVDRIESLALLTQQLELPLLWLHEHRPSAADVARVRESIDGMLTNDAGSLAEPGWLWRTGAGLDLETLELPDLPPRPPLRLLVLVESSETEALSVVFRALAIARGRSVDAQLVVVLTDGGVDPAEERQTMRAEIMDLALSRSVEVRTDVAPDLAALLTDAHVFVDTGGGENLSTVALRAMAHGRLVMSSKDDIRWLLEGTPVPLYFDARDSASLARRIEAIALAWEDALVRTGDALRRAVEQAHSTTHWAESIATVAALTRTERRDSAEPADRTSADGNAPGSARSVKRRGPPATPETPPRVPQPGTSRRTRRRR